MRKFTYLMMLAMVAVCFYSCKDSGTEPAEPTTFVSVDELVDYYGVLSTPAGYAKTAVGNSYDELDTNAAGVYYYSAASQKYSLNQEFSEIVTFGTTNASALYPGSIVQGKDIEKGVLTSIGDNFSRKPIKITMVNGGNTETVDMPTLENVNNAMNKLVNQANPTPAIMEYKYSEVHSAEQSLMSVGVSGSWGFLSGGFNYGKEKAIDKNSILLYFRQVYYTLAMDNKSDASDYFAADIDIDKLSKKTGKGNPLCVVSSVDYGRIIMVKVTSTKSYESMNKDIKAGISFMAGSIGGSYKTNKSSFDDSYTFEAQVLGGNAKDAATAIVGNDINAIFDLIVKGAEYGKGNAGYPISYRVKHLKDGSIAKVGAATDYVEAGWKAYNMNLRIRFDKINLIKASSSYDYIKAYYKIWELYTKLQSPKIINFPKIINLIYHIFLLNIMY